MTPESTLLGGTNESNTATLDKGIRNKLAANYAANNREIGGVIPTIKLISADEVYEVPTLWL